MQSTTYLQTRSSKPWYRTCASTRQVGGMRRHITPPDSQKQNHRCWYRPCRHAGRLLKIPGRNSSAKMFRTQRYRTTGVAGGLMSYAADFSHLFHRSAAYVHKVFNSSKPAEIAVEQAKKSDFTVDLNRRSKPGLGFHRASRSRLIRSESELSLVPVKRPGENNSLH